MGKVNDYASVVAKLRARIGLMRDSATIDNMIKAPTLAESINVLASTRHASLVDIYSKTGDLQQVELQLFADEVKNYISISEMLPPRASGFLNVLLSKLEIENLKNALRLWYSEAVRHHSIRYRASYLYKDVIVNQINWDGIINASTYNLVLESVKESPYYSVLSAFSYESISSKGLFDLEISLDQYYFRHLMEAVERLNKEDKALASDLYSVDIDLKNILLLVRYGYYHELSIEELRKIIIPFGLIYNEFAKVNTTESTDLLKNMRRIVGTKYPDIRVEIDDVRRSNDDLTNKDDNAKQILLIENYLATVRKKEYTHMLVGNPFSIGVVLAYFFLSSGEDSIIRAILSAKYYNWSEEKIREAIVR